MSQVWPHNYIKDRWRLDISPELLNNRLRSCLVLLHRMRREDVDFRRMYVWYRSQSLPEIVGIGFGEHTKQAELFVIGFKGNIIEREVMEQVDIILRKYRQPE